MWYLLFIFVIITQCCITLASDGDQSPFYRNCVKTCSSTKCTEDGQKFVSQEAQDEQDFWSRALFWSCKEECQYTCMWKTVNIYQQRGYSVPKFHGKWPFTRIYGVQEPASAFASLLNFAAHCYMWNELRDWLNVDHSAPALFWNVFVCVCIHGWIWSTIFHTRDWPATEFLDYACALSMVMMLFIASLLRVTKNYPRVMFPLLVSAVLYYLEHVRYLYYVQRMDYDYNMIVNISFGLLASIIWIVWGVHSYWSGRRYTWRLLAFIALSGATLSLELGDFPPLGGAWDAHAFWHLSTAPLPFLFYRFVLDDLKYLQQKLPIKKSDIKLP